jgi:hypothetical protein
MSDQFIGEPAAWPSAVILPPGHVNIEVKILCIQYAKIKEALISSDGDPANAVWVPLSRIAILKMGEKMIATVPKDLAASMRSKGRR